MADRFQYITISLLIAVQDFGILLEIYQQRRQRMDFIISHAIQHSESYYTSRMIIAIAVGLIGVLVIVLMPGKKCPDCNRPLPKYGNPKKNRKQGVTNLWVTCQYCGCQVDTSGNKIIKKSK